VQRLNLHPPASLSTLCAPAASIRPCSLASRQHSASSKGNGLRRFPLVGRYAKTSEIAAIASWLLFEAPLYLTGDVIPVDGGSAAQ
jgi:NAD(P)-dependent dehydrogenase (short-subunit alcohol dehydrogenase family)